MYNLGYYRKTNKFTTNQLYRHFGLKKRSIHKVNFDELLQDAFSLISGD